MFQRGNGSMDMILQLAHSLYDSISSNISNNWFRDSQKSRNNLLFLESFLSYFHAYIPPSHHLVEFYILCIRITGCFWCISKHPFFGCFFISFPFETMELIQFADKTRQKLRWLQAGRWTDVHPRPDKTIYEIILGVTWMVSETLSWEKLPR